MRNIQMVIIRRLNEVIEPKISLITNWHAMRLHCSLYTFDMRNLSRAACVHMDHVLSGMYCHICFASTVYVKSTMLLECVFVA